MSASAVRPWCVISEGFMMGMITLNDGSRIDVRRWCCLSNDIGKLGRESYGALTFLVGKCVCNCQSCAHIPQDHQKVLRKWALMDGKGEVYAEVRQVVRNSFLQAPGGLSISNSLILNQIAKL